MKKKIFLTLFLVIAMMLTLVLVASAETPSLYIEFKVKLSGATEYTTAYTKNLNNASSPKLSFNENFYSDVEFTTAIDKSTIVGIDMSDAVTHNTSDGSTGTVKELVSSSTALTSVEEIKFPTASTFTNITSKFCKNWTSLKTIDFGNATAIGDNAFEGCGVTSVTIPSTITSMRNNSFAGCVDLASVKFEGDVGYLGSNIFGKCTALTSIDISPLTAMGSSMFNACSALTAVEIPAGIKTIASQAFLSCSLLSSVTLNEGLQTIGSRAFESCALTSVTIPASVTELGDKAFYNNKSLASVVYADGTTLATIGSDTFSYVPATNLTIPSTVTKIGNSAFYNCTGLSSVRLDGITFGTNVFRGCTGLTSVTIPASYTTIPTGIFYDCKNITSVTFEDEAKITSVGNYAFYSVPATNLIVPSNVTSIGESAYHKCTGLSSVVIPKELTVLSKNVFSGCTGLTSVVFEDESTITELKEGAFYNVPATNLIIPSKITAIGSNAYAKSGLSGEIVISKDITSVGNSAFENCTKITSVVFEEGFSGTLGTSSFTGLKYVTKLVLVEGITALPYQCFWGIGNGSGAECLIDRVVLPDSVKTLAGRSLNGTGIRELVINETSQLERIEGDALNGNRHFTSIYLPDGVVLTGATFKYCYDLETVENFENAVMEITVNGEKQCVLPDGLFLETSIKEVKIPNGVTAINSNAFNRCEDLTAVYIPASVTSISNTAFPTNVTTSEDVAVYYCGTDEQLAALAQNSTLISTRVEAGTMTSANTCDVYYAGIHEESSEITLVWLDKDDNAGEAFLSYLKVACPCGRGCGEETVIETLAPLFVDRGFSYGPNSMLQGVAVDRELLDEYGNYFTGIKYGLVAAAKSAQASASIIDANGVGANGYVAAVDYTERDYDLFEMNLYGISEDYQATEFYFGAYVIADGQVYYIHNGTTNNEAQAITYDDVVVIVDALVPEKEEE